MHSKILYTALAVFGLMMPTTSYAFFSYEKADVAPVELKQEQPKTETKVESKAISPAKNDPVKVADNPTPVNKGKVEVTAIKEPATKAITEIKKTGEFNPIIKPMATFTLGMGSLQAQLEKFSKDNSYALVWNAENDYYLEAVTVFSGSYEEIIKEIFKALKGNNIFLKGTLYSNNVLEIKD